ncbi:MAG: hypothetical protein AAF449_17340, partial [Myxococcota bacterium]
MPNTASRGGYIWWVLLLVGLLGLAAGATAVVSLNTHEAPTADPDSALQVVRSGLKDDTTSPSAAVRGAVATLIRSDECKTAYESIDSGANRDQVEQAVNACRSIYCSMWPFNRPQACSSAGLSCKNSEERDAQLK